MVSQRCSSSGSSSYSSPSADGEGRRGGAVDRMVKIELEAAEALADLAHFAKRESETGLESAGKWGSKGKRAMKRVKSESPAAAAAAADCRFNAVDSAPTDRSEQDQEGEDQRRSGDLCRDIIKKPTKAEEEAHILRLCSTTYSLFGGSRSRQNLTEAEKEARKLRRILANRESARQTIRRRQALCEELARKAADLSWENEKLKREKELALKEYQSLETTNKDLKSRVAKAMKAEAEQAEGEARTGQVDVTTSPPTNCPLVLYNSPPFTPLFWPAVIPSSNTNQSQHGPQNPPSLPSVGPVSALSKPDMSNKQENHININGSGTPIYLVPCPWFFPFPDHGNGLHPQPLPLFCTNSKQDEISSSNQNSVSASSKNVVTLEINSPTLSLKARTEDSGSIEGRPINDLNETFVGFSKNGGGTTNSKETFLSLAPASCSSVRPAFNDRHADSHQRDFTAKVDVISSKANQNVNSLPEQNQEQDMYPGKKLMDAVAAAEARKRRKYLTKLKNLHGRQCRMHC